MNLLEIFENSDDLLKFPAGTTIFEEGSEGDFMYVVMEGKVRLSLHNEYIAEESPGGIVGEMALLNSDDRSATAGRSAAPGERKNCALSHCSHEIVATTPFLNTIAVPCTPCDRHLACQVLHHRFRVSDSSKKQVINFD